jgi:hypothetical protein
VSWPEPRRLRVSGLDEEVWAHQGTIRGTLPLAFTAPAGGGDHLLEAVLRYQVCGDGLCAPPESVRLALPVREVALVDRTLPTPKA